MYCNNKLTRICAWCKKILEQGNPAKISHGICHDCFEKELEKIERSEKNAKLQKRK